MVPDIRPNRERPNWSALSVPPHKALVTPVFPHPEPYVESLELGRFVLDNTARAILDSGEIESFAGSVNQII